MTREAEVEGIGVLEFPDDTPDEVIAATVKRTISGGAPPPAQQAAVQPAPHQAVSPPSGIEQLKEAINQGVLPFGLGYMPRELRDNVVRSAVKGMSGLALMPADFGTMVYNAGAAHTDPYSVTINGKKEMRQAGNLPLPSEAVEESLDQQIPAPQGMAGKTAEFVNSMLMGSALSPGSLASKAAKQLPAAITPRRGTEVIEAGRKQAVPVFYDDVAPTGSIAKKMSIAAESLGPLGTGAGRARQAEAAAQAAKRVTNQLSTGEGDEIPVLVQQGLQRQLGVFRKTAGKLYDKVGTELDPHGYVPTPAFNRTLNTLMNEETRLQSLSNKAVVDVLNKYKQTGLGNFSDTRKLRSQLGEEISEFYNGRNETIGEKGAEKLQSLKDSLETDIGAFAQEVGGNAKKTWEQANGFYKRNLVPFKEAGFRELAKTAEPEKAWRYLLAQGGIKSRAARMYNSLDEKGRANVRYGLVNDAYQNALTPKGGFSPAKFSKYIEDHEAPINTFFRGNERDEIKGFATLMRHIERAGQYAENPPTGQRLMIPLLFGSAAISPKLAGTVLGSGLGSKYLFQTERGRDLLLRLAHSKPGSQSADALVQIIRKNLLSATAQAETTGDVRETLNETLEP